VAWIERTAVRFSPIAGTAMRQVVIGLVLDDPAHQSGAHDAGSVEQKHGVARSVGNRVSPSRRSQSFSGISGYYQGLGRG
jgi:hypothetical protein